MDIDNFHNFFYLYFIVVSTQPPSSFLRLYANRSMAIVVYVDVIDLRIPLEVTPQSIQDESLVLLAIKVDFTALTSVSPSPVLQKLNARLHSRKHRFFLDHLSGELPNFIVIIVMCFGAVERIVFEFL